MAAISVAFCYCGNKFAAQSGLKNHCAVLGVYSEDELCAFCVVGTMAEQ